MGCLYLDASSKAKKEKAEFNQSMIPKLSYDHNPRFMVEKHKNRLVVFHFRDEMIPIVLEM